MKNSHRQSVKHKKFINHQPEELNSFPESGKMLLIYMSLHCQWTTMTTRVHSVAGERLFFIIYQQSNWKWPLNGSAVENVRTYSITCPLVLLVSLIFMCVRLGCDKLAWPRKNLVQWFQVNLMVSGRLMCVWCARESHKFIESHELRVLPQKAVITWIDHRSTSRIM